VLIGLRIGQLTILDSLVKSNKSLKINSNYMMNLMKRGKMFNYEDALRDHLGIESNIAFA